MIRRYAYRGGRFLDIVDPPSDGQHRAMLAPIVLRATEPVRHVLKLQFTKM
jgi:hypothetical protein